MTEHIHEGESDYMTDEEAMDDENEEEMSYGNKEKTKNKDVGATRGDT